MSRRIAVLLALVLGLFMVEPAYASPVDGFANGLNDFVHPDSSVQTVVTPEQDFIEEYEPVQNEVRTVEVNEIEGPYDGIVSFVNSTQTMQAFGNSMGWIQYARILLTSSAIGVIPAAVLLVFVWWGVRKAIRMVMAAFRKGRMTT